MNTSPQFDPSVVPAKMHEAVVYHEMGLYEESLRICNELLLHAKSIEPARVEEILKRSADARRRIQEMEAEPSVNGSVSSREMAILQQQLQQETRTEDILESASALFELGLFAQASAEYEKAFRKEPGTPRILRIYFDCLLKWMTPKKATESLLPVILESSETNASKVAQMVVLAEELEVRDHRDQALELLKTAMQLDPANAAIDEKIRSYLAQATPGSRYDVLINKRLISPAQLQKALVIAQKSRKSVETVLIEEFQIPKPEIGESLSRYYGCPFRSFDPQANLPKEISRSLKKSFLLHDMWVPVNWSNNTIEILVDDPKDIRKTDHIKALIKIQQIHLCVGIREDIERFIHLLFDESAVSAAEESIDLERLIPDIAFDEEREPEEELAILDENASQVVRLVDQILVTAYRSGVSDIHIEPSDVTKKTGIRFRMDGVCQEYLKVPNTMAKGLLSRIKILANLDISERRLPQDGKIVFRRKGVPPFELRVATIPTAGGWEDAVLRILAKAGAMPLDKMGLNERNLGILKKIVAQPYGLILVVGPTGSGKTTTLHAALGYINKPGTKIWTAEDPVEITQAGLRQVEVKPRIGLDFARVMRSFLRADPDVIMIGEMRDEETASIGIEASLTGHLVFSTLHTNSAPETVTRLLDMGMNPLNFSDAFLGVLAQRLVRTLCRQCKQAYHPDAAEFQEIVDEYGREDFQKTGIVYSPDLVLYRPNGCEACSGSGYKGRMGIHELMEGTKEIKRLIKIKAPTEELLERAKSEGMSTLKQDGILKVLQGLTDIREVRRVCIA
ncbi:ATPase, T2SS/T4P/T4SS family [Desulfatirhabdium butyrativorans]|uniref:ATPase, T2SS/T4P/T4SS family n=1 Tax=Desulfatirhabdium butyrativorans TaxID=340467 RepID=UPI00041BE9BE|nr:ATPase, T2SS/T4P/T4SS family [Desulfatirhabdium butyrativorans]